MIQNIAQKDTIPPGFCLNLSNNQYYYTPLSLFDSCYSFYAWNLLIFESYVDNEINYVIECISKEDTIFDIGSKLGTYSVSISNKVGKNGHIFTVENNTDFTNIIYANIAYHSIKNIHISSTMDDTQLSDKLLKNCSFIRISAENYYDSGLSILESVLRFQNPIILIDFSNALDAIQIIVSQMHERGFKPYQYCHSLNILIQISEDNILKFNRIFFCNQKKSEQLNMREMLAFKQTPGNIPAPKTKHFKDWFIENIPYIKYFQHILVEKPEGHDNYKTALCYYIDAQNKNLFDSNIRHESLSLSYQTLSTLSHDQLNLSRLLTFSRVTYDLGFIDETIKILEDIYMYLTSRQDLSLEEFFLLPNKSFETNFDTDNIGNWLLCAVIYALIEVKYRNFEESNEMTLFLLDILEECGYLLPKAERYKQVLEVKYGHRKSLCPSPSLTLPQRDNLNSSFWKNLE